MIRELEECKNYTGIDSLIEKVLEKTGYDIYISALPNGNIRIANINMLMKKAEEFEKNSFNGLFNFLRYIEKCRYHDIDFAEAQMDTGSDDKVQITTIHKSKGLEYPVVFLVGLGRQFNQMDEKKDVYVDGDRLPDYDDEKASNSNGEWAWGQIERINNATLVQAFPADARKQAIIDYICDKMENMSGADEETLSMYARDDEAPFDWNEGQNVYKNIEKALVTDNMGFIYEYLYTEIETGNNDIDDILDQLNLYKSLISSNAENTVLDEDRYEDNIQEFLEEDVVPQAAELLSKDKDFLVFSGEDSKYAEERITKSTVAYIEDVIVNAFQRTDIFQTAERNEFYAEYVVPYLENGSFMSDIIADAYNVVIDEAMVIARKRITEQLDNDVTAKIVDDMVVDDDIMDKLCETLYGTYPRDSMISDRFYDYKEAIKSYLAGKLTEDKINMALTTSEQHFFHDVITRDGYLEQASTDLMKTLHPVMELQKSYMDKEDPTVEERSARMERWAEQAVELSRTQIKQKDHDVDEMTK